MKFIADLHIHSPFSRATSRESSPAGLAAWAKVKGINIVGTGDFTHPGWFSILKNQLEPAEPGLFRLKDEGSIPSIFPDLKPSDSPVRFLLSAEISSIYKRHGATRKVHNLLYVPDFDSASAINIKLAGIGNIESDGRPILGLDSRNLLEIFLEAAPEGFMVPAHIWTPWFSLFGSRSGFDTIEDCFGDLSEYIFALETGLSSDPDMNRLISELDRFALISNSDCHSPSKLGREANIFNTGFDYFSLRESLQKNSRENFCGTIEFFPEEGKYHADGHRDCKVCLEPKESRKFGNICPVCGKPLTIGVLHRVMELADRDAPVYKQNAPVVHSIIPLPEILAELLQLGVVSKEVNRQYGRVLSMFGSEFELLLDTPVDEIAASEPILAEAVDRMRQGRVIRKPGFDGEFGVITLFDNNEFDHFAGQGSLFADSPARRGRRKTIARLPLNEILQVKKELSNTNLPNSPNKQQQAAIQAGGSRILVAAGPGTGKTFTLVSRIARLLENGMADPSNIVAITFTTKAAEELRERLGKRCGLLADRIFVGTFHSFCLFHLKSENPTLSVIGPESRDRLLKRLLPELSISERKKIRDEIAAHFIMGENISDNAHKYINELMKLNAIDLDAIIPVFVKLMSADQNFCSIVKNAVTHIFVDEFQDLNGPQYDLVEQIADSAEVFAIGDPDQAIYAFRGSDLRFFFRFAEAPGTLVISLGTTYRSAPVILQASTALISRNLIRSGLPMESLSTEPRGSIEYNLLQSPAAEAEMVVRRIEELMGGVGNYSINTGRSGKNLPGEEKGRSFSDFAVLFRLGRQAEELIEALSRRGIPYQLVGSTPYYLSQNLKAVYYMIQAASGTDIIADWLALAGSLDGVGDTTIERLDAKLPLIGNFFAELANLPESLQPKGQFKDLSKIILRIADTASNHSNKEALLLAFDFLKIPHSTHESRRLLLLAGSFGRDIKAFSSHLRNYAAATVYDSRAEAVALMTCHSSKGLEFPVVFITGLEEGIFPCTLMGVPDVEEERRLFYVGMTRAKQKVILSSSSIRPWLGRELQSVSRFVNELPAESVERPSNTKHVRTIDEKNGPSQMELF